MRHLSDDREIHVQRFVCPDCASVHAKWAARCSNCRSLRGLTKMVPPPPAVVESPAVNEEERRGDTALVPVRPPHLAILRFPPPDPELAEPVAELVDLYPRDGGGPVPISEIEESSFVRDSTGLAPVDHVLGGGLVMGSVVLLAAPPGIGKSSLTLQVLAGLRQRNLYITGEETAAQIAATGRRVGAVSSRLYVHAETDLAVIFAHARKIRAQTVAIDSIQKMYCADVNGRPGSPGQIKAVCERLRKFAKDTDTALWVIGQVTSDGDIQGPRALEHEVDVVLSLEAGPGFEGNERILRCDNKNRFGATGVLGRFVITAEGFVAVDPDGWDQPL